MASNRVDRPTSLDQFRYIIVRFDRTNEQYEMIEPNRANTYMIGNLHKAHAWFASFGYEALGERVLSSAKNFGAGMMIMSENRAFGLDLCKIDVDAGITRKVDIDENRRMSDDPEAEDDAIGFVSGLATTIKLRVPKL